MDENLYFNVSSLARELSAIAESYFADIGLTPSDALLILIVNEKDEIQPSDISERISLAPSTITRMIEKMETRQIMVRRHIGKYTFVSTTEKGKNLNAAILDKWKETETLFQNTLGVDVVQSLNNFAQASKLLFKKKR